MSGEKEKKKKDNWVFPCVNAAGMAYAKNNLSTPYAAPRTWHTGMRLGTLDSGPSRRAVCLTGYVLCRVAESQANDRATRMASLDDSQKLKICIF